MSVSSVSPQQESGSSWKLFSASAESFCLLTPFFLVPLVIWEIATNANASFALFLVATNLVEGVFGSSGHTGLTAGLIYLTPEGRGWWRDNRSRQLGLKLILMATGIFLFFTTVFFLASPTVLKVVFVLYSMASLQHAIAQTQGFLFSYSFLNSPSAQEKALIDREHKKQKMIFHLMTLLSFTYPTDAIMGWGYFESTASKMMVLLLGFALAAGLVQSNWRLSSNQKRKNIYLARILCIPLGPFSTIAHHGIRFLHGIEYMLFYRKMILKADTESLVTKSQVIWFSILSYALVNFIWLFTFFGSEGISYFHDFVDGKPWWICVLGALASTRALMHFWVDRLLFSMRDPVSKKWIGALLAPRSRTDDTLFSYDPTFKLEQKEAKQFSKPA